MFLVIKNDHSIAHEYYVHVKGGQGGFSAFEFIKDPLKNLSPIFDQL